MKKHFPLIAALLVLAVVLSSGVSHAEWTPLLAAADFDGIRDDMLTMVAGVISILLIVVGLGFLIKSLVK